MQGMNSTSSPFPSSSPSSSETKHSKVLSSPSSSLLRLWRPAAQRNLRNQWSKLLSQKQQWASASSSGRVHATSVVNAHLSQRYIPVMELGVLSDMPSIRERALQKLVRQQELHRGKLLSAYKDMVVVVSHMFNTSSFMRCFFKGPSNSPLVQFSSCSEDENDSGDGGGIPVFTFWSIPYFENLAQELVQMFSLELSLKRLLVVELLSISHEVMPHEANVLHWSDELYPGEFEDLTICSLYSRENCEPVPPRVMSWEFDNRWDAKSDRQPDREVLEVYITAWLAEVNIDTHRVDEIFAAVGEEMHVRLA